MVYQTGPSIFSKRSIFFHMLCDPMSRWVCPSNKWISATNKTRLYPIRSSDIRYFNSRHFEQQVDTTSDRKSLATWIQMTNCTHKSLPSLPISAASRSTLHTVGKRWSSLQEGPGNHLLWIACFGQMEPCLGLCHCCDKKILSVQW
jgi:hypothetical protein